VNKEFDKTLYVREEMLENSRGACFGGQKLIHIG